MTIKPRKTLDQPLDERKSSIALAGKEFFCPACLRRSRFPVCPASNRWIAHNGVRMA